MNLHDLQHARRQIVATGDFTALAGFFSNSCFSSSCTAQPVVQLICFLVGQTEFQPAVAAVCRASASTPPETAPHGIRLNRPAEDLQFFRQVFRLLELHLFDFQSTFVFFAPSRVKDLNVDNRTGDTVRYAQRRVFNVRRFSQSKIARSSFSSGVSWFHLRRHLFGRPECRRRLLPRRCKRYRFIQFGERSFTHVRDVMVISSNSACVTGHGQFLNVDGGERLRNHTPDTRMEFEVAAVPRHERDTRMF